MKFINILFPINLDSKNLSHLPKALELAKSLGSRIHFLYVNDPMAGYRHPTDREDAVSLKVRENASAELIDSMDVVYAVAKGNLDEEVKKYCTNNAVDLIVLGHKHRGKLYSSMFDSPDESIIDAIRIPVLIMPKN
ncbi:MAG: universal stress protein [Spirochaetes bacterium]|nr:universal stress protein [Spirochaetota bacterium]